MKISTLIGPDLNRAVAMALGHKFFPKPGTVGQYVKASGQPYFLADYVGDIALAWKILVTHKIDLQHILRFKNWTARIDRRTVEQPPVLGRDADPQVAAMRCFVASVYGEEITLP